jgi:hypothetical protein
MHLKKHLKIPCKGALLPFPPTGSRWREMLRLQSQWFIHSFIPLMVPKKDLSHEMQGEHTVTVHRALTRTEGLYMVGCGLVPQGSETSKPICVCRTQLVLEGYKTQLHIHIPALSRRCIRKQKNKILQLQLAMLGLLLPISWNASSGSLQSCFSRSIFLTSHSLQLYLRTSASKSLHLVSEGITLILYFSIHVSVCLFWAQQPPPPSVPWPPHS